MNLPPMPPVPDTTLLRGLIDPRDYDALRTAASAYLEALSWRPIETAPLDAIILLGWWEEWPAKQWCYAASIAGHENDKPPGMSNGWRHGYATHWMPLPEPPAIGEVPEETI